MDEGQRAGTGIGSAVWRAELSEGERARLESLLEEMAHDPLLQKVAIRPSRS